MHLVLSAVLINEHNKFVLGFSFHSYLSMIIATRHGMGRMERWKVGGRVLQQGNYFASHTCISPVFLKKYQVITIGNDLIQQNQVNKKCQRFWMERNIPEVFRRYCRDSQIINYRWPSIHLTFWDLETQHTLSQWAATWIFERNKLFEMVSSLLSIYCSSEIILSMGLNAWWDISKDGVILFQFTWWLKKYHSLCYQENYQMAHTCQSHARQCSVWILLGQLITPLVWPMNCCMISPFNFGIFMLTILFAAQLEIVNL